MINQQKTNKSVPLRRTLIVVYRRTVFSFECKREPAESCLAANWRSAYRFAASIDVNIVESPVVDTGINQQLEELFQSRYHGAANIKGIRYQIAYSIHRAFDLYEAETNASISLEGIEDVDLNGSREIETSGFRVSSQYVQVKTSKTDWDWGRFAQSKIIDNFLPVWSADPSARLLVVTNFGYAGKLAELVEVCQGRRRLPSTKLTNSLRTLCLRVGFAHVDPIELLNRVSFERMSDEELQSRIQAAIVRWFDLQTANTDLYLLVLMTKFTDLAVERREIRRLDMEAIRLSIQENIELGVNNPAVQNGWIERVRFNPEVQVDDYYEGANARPGHIVAGLDVERPAWLERIHDALQRRGTCIVRTSSGQGKSTLLYRYAYQHFQPETTFIVKQLSNESLVGSVKQAIMTRRALGLPILVLVDNVRAGLRYWYKLAAELAGQGIHILVTMREEDWYRYSGEISAFRWEIVTPSLSLAESRQIYKEFKEKNRVAESVSSAEWAFDQVSERKLLIEFTYLITHGQMLANRLSDQVREMERLKEDRAKLHVLRLVTVAQTYEAKVTLDSILRHVEFDGDPDSTLASLQMEYVLCDEGSCEGLHYVRSQHLATLLHQIVPLEQTVAELISILDTDNLEAFISSAFTDSSVSQTHLLKALMERVGTEPLEVITRIVRALCAASETLYCQKHQAQFARGIEEMGSQVTKLLCSATLPSQTIDSLGDLKKTFPDSPNLKLLSELAQTFSARRWDERIETRFLQNVIDDLTLDQSQSNFSRLGAFLYWCRLPGLNTSRLEQLLADNDWTECLYKSDLRGSADFIYELRHFARANYDSLVAANKGHLISRFKLLSETLLVEERGENIYVEFVADESDEARRPNEQAWERLRDLYKIFPEYQLYCSQGLYAIDYGMDRAVDDTHKEASNETLAKETEGDRNSIYLRSVNAHFATKFVYQWQEQWFNLRRDLSSLMTQFLRFFQNGSVKLDKLSEAWRELTYRLDHVIPLPDSLKEALANEDKHVREWSGSLGNFLRQLGQSHEKSRLMRRNLRSALKHLPAAQRAFERVTAYTEPYFDFTPLNWGEIDRYEDLADLLDIRFEEPERPLYDFRRLVRERREQRRRTFVEAVHAALAPLEEYGFVFHYPQDRLVDFHLIGICVGFEVLDFELAVDQLAVIISRLAPFPIEYHFLYLIPLLDGAIYSPRVWRISAESVAKLVAGESKDDPSMILPVEEPEDLTKVLPNIRHVVLPELDLFSQFYIVYTALNSIRNTAHFVMSRLDADQAYDVELGNLYQVRLQRRTDEILEAYSELTHQMIEFEQGLGPESDDSVQRIAWLELLHRCIEKFETLRDNLNVNPSSFESIGIWQDKELESLFGRYLNAKYRYPLIDEGGKPSSESAV